MNYEELKEKYLLKGYPKLESSTVALIKEAIRQGINYEIIDESRSFIKLNNDKKTEYVIQATRTSKDSYIFPFIVNDKEFVKQKLKENKLIVPKGIALEQSMSEAKQKQLIEDFINQRVVIKPRTTNCGTGITVFDRPATEAEIINAIKYAFQFDTGVIVEEYAEGQEYRFVVIDGKCISVAHRRSASVVGDGKKTIKELMEDKDKEPWHYILENPMVIDEPLKIFLANQGLTIESVPPKGKRIFLRRNSNCSTGGESVDMTDIMPERFKKIAEKATKIFKGNICGVDILINDIEKAEYSIVEINENPGICINEWPYEGKGQQIGLAILKLLELI